MKICDFAQLILPKWIILEQVDQLFPAQEYLVNPSGKKHCLRAQKRQILDTCFFIQHFMLNFHQFRENMRAHKFFQ